jgi:hypothetical protein
MSIKIYFDMDGTIADFYGQSDWLEKLRNEQNGAFADCKPLFNRKRFSAVVSRLLTIGVQFGVITWLPMDASPEYEEVCAAEKKKWCAAYLPFISEFTAQSYGVPKQKAIRKHSSTEILIDDNAEVCRRWKTAKQRDFSLVSGCFDGVCDALEEIARKLGA